MAEAENRNVWISSTTAGVVHYCSGVIISTGHVLTAGHCVGELISIDGVVAGVLKIDHIADLMLLNTKTADFEPVVINSEPVISEPVYTAANHEPRMGIFTMARIVWLDQDEVCAQTLAAPGVSGSAIYDSSGRLVTIAQQAQASHFDTGTPSVMFSIGVHPKKIAAFLGANP